MTRTTTHLSTPLRLLGPPALERSGTWQALVPERALWLLAALASRDEGMDRGQAMALLWPDADKNIAQARLRQLVYRTRKLGYAPALELEADRLRLPSGVDLIDFRHAFRGGRWQDVVDLYQGPLLEGVRTEGSDEYEAWLELERRNLELLWREAALNLASSFERAQRDREAADMLERVLKVDPLAEEVLLTYLRVAHRCGRRDRALEHYREFAARLKNELGLEPRPETHARFESLRRRSDLPSESSASTGPRLPRVETALIGRNTELTSLARLLKEGPVVTVVGYGGMGKTRLLLEFLTSQQGKYADGICFVPLAGQSEETSPAATVAQSLGLRLEGADPNTSLRQQLERKTMLLGLDNAEHRLEGLRLLLEALSGCPDLRVVVTSRERLRMTGERTLELGGLEQPTGAGENSGESGFEKSESVRLLLESLRRQQPGYVLNPQDQRAVYRLCRAVGGVPLALELAAGWARLLSLGEIADELERNLDFLEGVEGRVLGFRAAFEQTWERLSEGERQGLSALSALRGSFDLEAARTIAGVGHLELLALLDRSLLRRSRDLERRFELHELVRQYAREKLERDPSLLSYTFERVAQHFTQIAVQNHFKPKLLELDLENVQASVRWALEQGRLDEFKGLLAPIAQYYTALGHVGDGLLLLEKVLEHLSSTPDRPLYASSTVLYGTLLFHAQRYGEALERLEAILPRLYTAEQQKQRGNALNLIGALHGHIYGRLEPARGAYGEALELYQSLEMRAEVAMVLYNMAFLDRQAGHFEHAYGQYLSCLLEYEGLGQEFRVLQVKLELGAVLSELPGRAVEAETLLLAVLEQLEVAAQPRQGFMAALNLSSLKWRQGQLEKAQEYAEQMEVQAQKSGIAAQKINSLLFRGILALERGDSRGHEWVRVGLSLPIPSGNDSVVMFGLLNWALHVTRHTHPAVALVALARTRQESNARMFNLSPLEIEAEIERLSRTLSEQTVQAALERAKTVPLEVLVREMLLLDEVGERSTPIPKSSTPQ